MKYCFFSLSTVVFLLSGFSETLFAQSDAMIKSILTRQKNYRYSNISMFKLDNNSLKDLTQVLNPEPKISDFAKASALTPAKQSTIDDKINELGCAATIDGLTDDDDAKRVLRTAEGNDYAKYSVSKKQWECDNFKNAYIITTRYRNGEGFNIVALMTSKSDSRRLMTVLGGVMTTTYKELRNKSAPAGSSAKNLEEYLRNAIIQDACENVTADLQGIGEDIFLEKKYGVGQLVKEDDVAQYVRISEGQPMDYKKTRELIVSPDLISFKNYASKEAVEAASINPDVVYNRYLPKWGAELRYGSEPINYPSFFSERLALNAVWGQQRLGVILPTAGWSALGEAYGVTRTMTNAGFGITGSFDVPIKISNASTGVWNFGGTMVFGDAHASNHQREVFSGVASSDTIPSPDRSSSRLVRTRTTNGANDYLIRWNAHAHYTFAVQVDSGYFFRFRIGGAAYQREIWQQRNSSGKNLSQTLIGSSWRTIEEVDTTESKFDLSTNDGKRIFADVSARIEFMSTVGSTPYGLGLQYFDGSVMGDVWLQVPINDQIAVRIDGKLFAPALRSAREWEPTSVFVPSARVIYNF